MAQKPENEGMPVIRLDRQLKYQGNILKIYEDTVLANGHEAHWDYIHHDGAAAVLPVTDEGKILMVRHEVQQCLCLVFLRAVLQRSFTG